jgi:hypothetical protein
MRKWALISFAIIALLSGCRNSADMAVIGRWTGGFDALTIDGKEDPALSQQNRFSGFLQVYGGNNYVGEVESRLQRFTFRGTWTLNRNQLSLNVAELEFDNPADEDVRAMDLRIISAEDIRAGLGRTITLTLSQDGERLTGLENQFGHVELRPSFRRDMRTRS